jgi:nicotinamidase-related amidase
MLLSAGRSVLLLVDLQQRLMPAIHDGDRVVARAARLAEAALLLDVPVVATEQYPAGLGPTVAPLAGYPRATMAKTRFSAAAEPGFAALLLGSRHRVILAADAAGSRDPADHRAAIDRARQHGAEVVTSEMVLFEWLRDARHPRFRQVHKLLK